MYSIKLFVKSFCSSLFGGLGVSLCVVFFYIPKAVSYSPVEVPYQKNKQCNKRSQKLNQVFLTEAKKTKTEAKSQCIECNSRSSNKNKKTLLLMLPKITKPLHVINYYATKSNRPKTKSNDIHEACFFASTLKESDTNNKNFICNKSSQVGPRIGKVKPCFTKEYIALTKKAFDYTANCLGFNREQKKDLFKLFNHESHFSLNNRSPTQARCYGQISRGAFLDISKHIYRAINNEKDQSIIPSNFQSDIYKQALKKCPNITKKAGVISKISTPANNQTNYLNTQLKLASNEKFINRLPMTCSLTTNPYNCFLYSMYNVKLNVTSLDKTISKLLNQTRYRDFNKFLKSHNRFPEGRRARRKIDKIKKDFLFPLKPYEVLTFNGKIKKPNGRIEEVNFIFKNELEAYDIMKRYSYNIKSTGSAEIKKIPMFKLSQSKQRTDFDPNIKSILINTAYNGGVSIVTKTRYTYYLSNFLKNQSRFLSINHCKKASKSKDCLLRKKILKGESLSSEDFRNQLKNFLSINYLAKKKKRREEVANFQSKIDQDSDYFKKSNEHIKSHLDQMHSSKSNVSKEQKDEFLKYVKENCP